MNNDNICKFVPSEHMPTDVNTVNFVWETSCVAQDESIRSVYAMHLVMCGKGQFVCNGKTWDVEKGDIFFVRPSDMYAIKNVSGLEYAYVSFLGAGAPVLIGRIISPCDEPVFRHNDELISFWKKAIETANPLNTDLISKSVLQYSAALLIAYSPQSDNTQLMDEIERYMRSHFTEADLSLKTLSAKFGYNEKYLSKLFYRFTGIYFGDYLTHLRINAACALITEGQTVVKQIAYACGFCDALYFSKVFKRKMGCTPTEFIASKKSK